MKKILLIVFLIIANNAFSETLRCPLLIMCNYKKGICDGYNYKDFRLDDTSAGDSFDGTKKILLTEAITIWPREGKLLCAYRYSKDSVLSLLSTKNVSGTVGSGWKFMGFGNKAKGCKPISSGNECDIAV